MNTPLNAEQERAINHPGGPLLMAAGAGSGKTRALTGRLKALIGRGTPPHHIVAITFTNKAAREMRERVFGKANAEPRWSPHFPTFGEPFIGTFHSLGARIMKQEAAHFRRTPSFTIYDQDDSLSLVKLICKQMDLEKEAFKPAVVAGKISTVKSELKQISDFFESSDRRDQIFSEVFARYERALQEQNAFDFDDLIEKPVRLMLDNPELRKKYQDMFSQVMVDEYQDINTAQYQLIRLLAGAHQNVSVVGDDFQCLPPDTLISTPKGLKKIAELKKGELVTAASGGGDTVAMPITSVKKFKHAGQLVVITTEDGQKIKLTPNHIVFARLQLTENTHYVYLMYRKDKGFRIGLVKSSRSGSRGDRQIGLLVRCNQEKADKMWILKVCKDRAEAEYFEYYYAFTYGIPTVVFDTAGRSMKLTQGHVDQLFKKIDTAGKARVLMEKEHLFFSYPHWIPQGTIRHAAKRLRVRLTLFDDMRKSLASPWGMSRVSLNTSDQQLQSDLKARGFETRVGKIGKTKNWRFECAKLNYGELEGMIDTLQTINADIECVRSACLTKKKRLFFQPAAHVRPTMVIAIKKNDGIEEKVVRDVTFEEYTGPVYDLDVANVHNYVANNFVVHNSIYAFRGADFRNFLNFTRDWPNATIIKLEQNYRSTANIITAASAVIANNKTQTPKKLWTENPDGPLVKIVAAQDPDTESTWVAAEIRELRIANHKSQMGDKNMSVAVLYRTNMQSRAIEQALISENIPYKIYGGLKFYDRKEIKDVLAGLRLASNPQDAASSQRLQKSLGKRVGATVVAALSGRGKELPVVELIQLFLTTSSYNNLLEKDFNNPQERIDNITELVNFASSFTSLEEFLERAALLSSSDAPAGEQFEKDGGNPVNLMSIHIAKGLEFDTVFLIGCNEGVLPHERSMVSEDQIEEERRLMYVAMTRARKALYVLFHAFPSRFIYEIPKGLCEFVSPSGMMDKLPSEDDMWIEN